MTFVRLQSLVLISAEALVPLDRRMHQLVVAQGGAREELFVADGTNDRFVLVEVPPLVDPQRIG